MYDGKMTSAFGNPASPAHKNRDEDDGAMPVLDVSMFGPRDEVFDELDELRAKNAKLESENHALRKAQREQKSECDALRRKSKALVTSNEELASLCGELRTRLARRDAETRAFMKVTRADLDVLRNAVLQMCKEHALASASALSIARKRDDRHRAAAAAAAAAAAERDRRNVEEIDSHVAALVRAKLDLAETEFLRMTTPSKSAPPDVPETPPEKSPKPRIRRSPFSTRRERRGATR